MEEEAPSSLVEAFVAERVWQEESDSVTPAPGATCCPSCRCLRCCCRCHGAQEHCVRLLRCCGDAQHS